LLVQYTKTGKIVPNYYKIYKTTTKWQNNLPNCSEISNIFHSKALQMGFLVCKYTIWQPWHGSEELTKYIFQFSRVALLIHTYMYICTWRWLNLTGTQEK
jgi:hypothetical protein